jgi:hypothetical protein
MNKTKIIGLTVTVLAVIGGVAVYNWAKNPKRNSDGFFNASGRSGGMASARVLQRPYGVRCKRPDGSFYQTQVGQEYCTYSSDTIVGYGSGSGREL